MTDFLQSEQEVQFAPVLVGEVNDASPVEGEDVEGEDVEVEDVEDGDGANLRFQLAYPID